MGRKGRKLILFLFSVKSNAGGQNTDKWTFKHSLVVTQISLGDILITNFFLN